MSKIVERTLDFIELFAEHKRPLTLSDITRLLEIPVSSCHDVLQAMQARGYLIEVAPRAGFYPTMRLFNLASTIAQHDPVLLRAEARLRSLRDELDESVSLGKATGLRVIYLLVLEASHPLRFLVAVGSEVRSLHATSAGKAVLGSLSPEELDTFLESRRLDPMTPKTVTTASRLRAELQASNRRGWFSNEEESEPGATTVSARFTWNRSVYVVTVAGPTGRIQPQMERIAAALAAACQDLGAPEAAGSLSEPPRGEFARTR